MAISLRQLKACKRAAPYEFAGYEGETIVMRRKSSDWRRRAEWLREHQWPARVVIVVGEVTILYVIFVFGILIGAGLSGGE